MTVITYRAGVLAADRLITNDRGLVIGTTCKIIRVGDKLIGVAGDAPDCNRFLAWMTSGEALGDPMPKLDDHIESIVAENGKILRYDKSGRSDELNAEYFAIGYGALVAMGAMWAGADAVKAVEAACALIVGCGGGIDVLLANPVTVIRGGPDDPPSPRRHRLVKAGRRRLHPARAQR